MTPTVGNLRRTATLVFWAMVALPFVFLVVVWEFRTAEPGRPDLAELFFWIAIASSVFQVALSRLLPPRIGPAASGPDAVAFARMLVGWALCESAALFPLVAWVVTGDPRLVGVFVVDLFALVLLYPGEARWEALTPAAPGGRPPPGPTRMVR